MRSNWLQLFAKVRILVLVVVQYATDRSLQQNSAIHELSFVMGLCT